MSDTVDTLKQIIEQLKAENQLLKEEIARLKWAALEHD